MDRARVWGVPLASVVADAGDGDTPTFLQGIESHPSAYVVDSNLGLRAAMSLARLWQQGKRAEAYDLLASIYGC